MNQETPMAQGPVDVNVSPLLPCPFCGEDGETIDTHGWLDGDGNYGPQCLNCGATAESEEKWNMRSGADVQRLQRDVAALLANAGGKRSDD